jgi:Tol biopolymer transport system component
VENPNAKVPQDWSRDGRYFLFSEQDAKTGFDLKALPMTGNDRKPVVVVSTPFDERHGQFSPDGRWAAYATNESVRHEVVLQPFPEPTGKWQVSTGGGVQPRWRADGHELYFIAPDGKLMAASVTPSSTTIAASAPVALFQTRILAAGSAATAKPNYAVSRGRPLPDPRAGR